MHLCCCTYPVEHLLGGVLYLYSKRQAPDEERPLDEAYSLQCIQGVAGGLECQCGPESGATHVCPRFGIPAARFSRLGIYRWAKRQAFPLSFFLFPALLLVREQQTST